MACKILFRSAAPAKRLRMWTSPGSAAYSANGHIATRAAKGGLVNLEPSLVDLVGSRPWHQQDGGDEPATMRQPPAAPRQRRAAKVRYRLARRPRRRDASGLRTRRLSVVKRGVHTSVPYRDHTLSGRATAIRRRQGGRAGKLARCAMPSQNAGQPGLRRRAAPTRRRKTARSAAEWPAGRSTGCPDKQGEWQAPGRHLSLRAGSGVIHIHLCTYTYTNVHETKYNSARATIHMYTCQYVHVNMHTHILT